MPPEHTAAARVPEGARRDGAALALRESDPARLREPYREGIDYTVDDQGRWVFTARHLEARGTCCFQACRNCPWGQAGRSRKQAFQDLQARLQRLETRLQERGFAIEVTGYRLGVLFARPVREACLTDLPALGRRVREEAGDLLTVAEVAWE
jgi:hypothetical protein